MSPRTVSTDTSAPAPSIVTLVFMPLTLIGIHGGTVTV
jgi:hypothetical protein